MEFIDGCSRVFRATSTLIVVSEVQWRQPGQLVFMLIQQPILNKSAGRDCSDVPHEPSAVRLSSQPDPLHQESNGNEGEDSFIVSANP